MPHTTQQLEALLKRAAERLQWFLDNDETNRGDCPLEEYGGASWDEINGYWIKGADEAQALVTELNEVLSDATKG